MAARRASRATPPWMTTTPSAADGGRDLLLKVFQRVAGLGEDDDLAPQARDGVADDRIVEDRQQLTPFRVLARLLEAERLILKHLQVVDLGAQLDRGPGRRSPHRGFPPRRPRLPRPGPRRPRRDRSSGDRALGSGRSTERPQRLLLAKPLLQPLAAALQRFVDRGRRRGQAPLQDLQGEADVGPPLAVLAEFGAVHLLAHVCGDGGVKRRLVRREAVARGVGAPLGEQRRAVEAVQLLLGQPPHHVGDVGLVDALAEPALETVGVEQAHEELEVRLLAVVRRRRHQQQVSGSRAQQPAELVAPASP